MTETSSPQDRPVQEGDLHTRVGIPRDDDGRQVSTVTPEQENFARVTDGTVEPGHHSGVLHVDDPAEDTGPDRELLPGESLADLGDQTEPGATRQRIDETSADPDDRLRAPTD